MAHKKAVPNIQTFSREVNRRHKKKGGADSWENGTDKMQQ